MMDKSHTEGKSSDQQTLWEKYRAVLEKKAPLSDFIIFTKAMKGEEKYTQDSADIFADYTTKLMISCMQNNNYNEAKEVLYHYTDNLLPHSFLVNKSNDIASMGIVLSLLSESREISNKVFDKILGKNFHVYGTDNNILLFNLACYYAFNKEKNKMLQAIRQAVYYGKHSESFTEDSDFSYYWEDKEFLSLMNESYNIRRAGRRGVDAKKMEFDVRITASNRKSILFDTRYEKIYGMDAGFPLYELLDPVRMFLSLGEWESNKSLVTIIDDMKIDNPDGFFKCFKKINNMYVNSYLVVPDDSSIGALSHNRLSEDRLNIFHVPSESENTQKKSSILHQVSFSDYINKVLKLVSLYERLKLSVQTHVQEYFSGSMYSEEMNGLRAGLSGGKLLPSNVSNHSFKIELKNVSTRSIYLIDNMNTHCHVSDELYISISAQPADGVDIIELKPDKVIVLQCEVDLGFVKYINLNVRMDNIYPLRTNVYQRKPQPGSQEYIRQARDSERFLQAWSGCISHKIPVFSLQQTWQDDVGTKDEFDVWISKFNIRN